MTNHYKLAGALGITVAAIGTPRGAFAQNECDFTATTIVSRPTCGETNGYIDLMVTGGTPPYYYTWSTGAMTEDLSGVGVGSYWVFVADFTQCYWKFDVEVLCDEEESCVFRTQTQGGWGANPNGNNPAMYLQNHFAQCFPNGITIGCATNNTLTLTSSTAVKNFLPSGSTPSMLPSDLVNPGGGYNNVLAGQLVAATINVTVDACDPAFSDASGWSGNLVYLNGTFAGWTVQQVIDAANQFIGGCGGGYSASTFNAALTMFNENYANGTVDNGNFECQVSKGEDKSLMSGANIFMSPNPAHGPLRVTLNSGNEAVATVTVLDLSGRVVIATTSMGSASNGFLSTELDLSGLNGGTYVVAVDQNGTRQVERVVITR